MLPMERGYRRTGAVSERFCLMFGIADSSGDFGIKSALSA